MFFGLFFSDPLTIREMTWNMNIREFLVCLNFSKCFFSDLKTIREKIISENIREIRISEKYIYPRNIYIHIRETFISEIFIHPWKFYIWAPYSLLVQNLSKSRIPYIRDWSASCEWERFVSSSGPLLFEKFKEFQNEVQNQLDKRIKILRSDRGREY